jgi:hypothetical protein
LRIKAVATTLILLWSAAAGIHAMATDKLAWEGAQVGSRVPWERVTEQFLEREAGRTDEVNIYALTSSSDGIKSGYWTIAMSVGFYLDRSNQTRFHMIGTNSVSTLPAADPGDHFWVAYFKLDERSPLPPQVLSARGYEVGEEIRVSGANGKAFLLFPVQKPNP